VLKSRQISAAGRFAQPRPRQLGPGGPVGSAPTLRKITSGGRRGGHIAGHRRPSDSITCVSSVEVIALHPTPSPVVESVPEQASSGRFLSIRSEPHNRGSEAIRFDPVHPLRRWPVPENLWTRPEALQMDRLNERRGVEEFSHGASTPGQRATIGKCLQSPAPARTRCRTLFEKDSRRSLCESRR
jgi:hypothetical protein